MLRDGVTQRTKAGAEWQPASVSGRYELRELLGEGGSGRVYRAFDRVLARDVALKSLKTVSAEDIYRLKKEFRTLVDLAHPNVIRLYDLVATADQCFFTMELIEGPDLLTWIWREGRPAAGQVLGHAGIARLRRGVGQLVRAVGALHDLGRVHRDIKPSNVLVAPGDRVVLLDVGLVSRLESRESERSRAGSVAGTLQYMAPEQAWGQITPAADWYSLGIVLFEALSGRLPYEGAAQFRSLRRPPREPVPACPDGTPQAIADLVLALLNPDPAQRPGDEQVLSALGDGQPASGRRGARRFVGRERELATLERLYAASQGGRSVFCRVRAPPGFGKTDLVSTFASRKERLDDVLVLRGRCHYREYVMFKALDGVVDNLTRYMARLDPSELPEWLPDDVAALFQVFPVFRRIEALALLHSPVPAVYDFRLRHRAFVALREILRRIASRRGLILWIDDLQWADRDSTLFLRSLQQATPLSRLLCVYTFRDGAPLDGYVSALATSDVRGGVVEDLAIGPLAAEDARALVHQMAPGATDEQAEAIGATGGGVPLLVQVLCGPLFHHAGALNVSGLRTFDDFMRVIVAELPAPAPEVLRTICLAGYGIEHRLLATLWLADSEAAISRLYEAGLVRQIERERLRWEPAHDKIREAVTSQMNPEERRATNERTMQALEGLKDPDPHDLLEHLLTGGHAERACERALEAAHDADRRASFQLASSLYRRALVLGLPQSEAGRIRARLGHALVNLGLGKEGATELVAAANVLAAERPGDPEAVRLRCVAGERLLLGGHWNEGLSLVGEAMKTVGVPQSDSAGGALARALLLMPSAALKKRRWKHRTSEAPRELGQEEALRLEVVWSAGLAISWLDPMRAIELHVRHAALAYASGDLGHIARSKSVEAIILAMRGGASRWQKAIEVQEGAQRLANSSGDPEVQAFIALHWGLVHYFMGRWRDALRMCRHAIELGYTKGISAFPEMLLAQWAAMTSHAYLGEIDEIRSRLADCLMAVEARDEQLSISCMRLGWINLMYLCDDDVEGATAEARRGFAPFERAVFNSVHYLNVIAQVNAELYRRQPDAAWHAVHGAWKGLVASRQLGMTTVQCEMYEVRGRVALARGAAAEVGSDRFDESIADLRRCIRELSGSSMECAQGFAGVLGAGAAWLEQKERDAIESLEGALMVFARLEMNMHAACCRLRLSSCLQGSRAEELRATADAWFAAQAIRQPSRIVEVLLGPSGRRDSPAALA